MTESSDAAVSIESALNARFRGHLDPDERSALVTSAGEVPIDAKRARLKRVKSSHRGIRDRHALEHLVADAADQAYLDEICTITALERLDLEYPVTARHLDGLRALTRLRHLRIDSPRNVTDFNPLLDLPSLTTLLVVNARHMADINWLAGAHHLEVLGIEGSIWTLQTIPTLKPIAGLRSLRAFFAVSTRLGDQDLSPLAACPMLEFLGCARVAGREEFERLQSMKPDLICAWFRPEQWA